MDPGVSSATSCIADLGSISSLEQHLQSCLLALFHACAHDGMKCKSVSTAVDTKAHSHASSHNGIQISLVDIPVDLSAPFHASSTDATKPGSINATLNKIINIKTLIHRVSNTGFDGRLGLKDIMIAKHTATNDPAHLSFGLDERWMEHWADQNRTPNSIQEYSKPDYRPSSFYDNIVTEKLPIELIEKVFWYLSAEDRDVLAYISLFRNAVLNRSATVRFTSETGTDLISLARLAVPGISEDRQLVLEPILKEEHPDIKILTFNNNVNSAKQMMVGLSLATTCDCITRLEFYGASIIDSAFDLIIHDFPNLKQISIERCCMVSNEAVLDFFTRPWRNHIELNFVLPFWDQFRPCISWCDAEQYSRTCFALLLRYAHEILRYQPQLLSRRGAFYEGLISIFSIHSADLDRYHHAFTALLATVEQYAPVSSGIQTPSLVKYDEAAKALVAIVIGDKRDSYRQDSSGGGMIHCREHQQDFPSDCYLYQGPEDELGQPQPEWGCALCIWLREHTYEYLDSDRVGENLNKLLRSRYPVFEHLKKQQVMEVARHIRAGGSTEEGSARADLVYRIKFEEHFVADESWHLDLTEEEVENDTLLTRETLEHIPCDLDHIVVPPKCLDISNDRRYSRVRTSKAILSGGV